MCVCTIATKINDSLIGIKLSEKLQNSLNEICSQQQICRLVYVIMGK